MHKCRVKYTNRQYYYHKRLYDDDDILFWMKLNRFFFISAVWSVQNELCQLKLFEFYFIWINLCPLFACFIWWQIKKLKMCACIFVVISLQIWSRRNGLFNQQTPKIKNQLFNAECEIAFTIPIFACFFLVLFCHSIDIKE